jgi:hypothetical protein
MTIPCWKRISFERDLRRLILHRVNELVENPAELRILVDRLIAESKARQDALEYEYFSAIGFDQDERARVAGSSPAKTG